MIIFATATWNRLGDAGTWNIAEKVVRTVAVYLAILVLLRLFGKRELAQLNSFDLVVLLLLSNVVQNAIIGPETSLWGGMLGAATLLAINALVVRTVKRNQRLDDLFEGTPTRLMVDGALDREKLRHLALREGDVLTACRKQGASSLGEVDQATLFPGGAIVVQLKHRAENATKADVDHIEHKLNRVLVLLEASQR